MPGINDPRREFKPDVADQVALGDHDRRIKALQAQHGGSGGGAGGPHAPTHATDGSDPLTPGMIGAATAGHNHPAYETELADHETRILWLEQNGVGPGGGSGAGAGGVWLHGFGTPPDTLGSDGDFYMDVGSTAYFGPKADGAWPAGVELQGPPGIQGEPGADSTVPGPPGSDGVDGAPGEPGPVGPDGKSAYELWVEAGNTGGITDFLAALKGEKGDTGDTGADSTVPGPPGSPGADGKSAYQVWLDAGNTGTVADYLAAIKGEPGEAGADGAASTVPGPSGPPGPDGKSAYQVWLDAGHTGSVSDYLAALKGEKGDTGAASTVPGPTGPPGADSTVPGPTGPQGKSAYQVWLDAGNTGSVDDYLAAIKGDQGDPGLDGRGWYSGYVDPPSTLANDGDFYLNMTSHHYFHKEAGAWVDQGSLVGAAGAAGADGRTWYNGNGAPASGLGVTGDLYLDKTASAYYVKTSGGWGAPTSIVGPAGATGATGATGGQGPPGVTNTVVSVTPTAGALTLSVTHNLNQDLSMSRVAMSMQSDQIADPLDLLRYVPETGSQNALSPGGGGANYGPSSASVLLFDTLTELGVQPSAFADCTVTLGWKTQGTTFPNIGIILRRVGTTGTLWYFGQLFSTGLRWLFNGATAVGTAGAAPTFPTAKKGWLRAIADNTNGLTLQHWLTDPRLGGSPNSTATVTAVQLNASYTKAAAVTANVCMPGLRVEGTSGQTGFTLTEFSVFGPDLGTTTWRRVNAERLIRSIDASDPNTLVLNLWHPLPAVAHKVAIFPAG